MPNEIYRQDDCLIRELILSLSALSQEIRADRDERKHDCELKKGLLAIEKQLARLENSHMAISKAVQDYIDKNNAQLETLSTNVDELVTSQQGIATDVAFLKDVITKLQNNPGPISPEDQALLDQAVERVTTLSSKTQAVSTALKELDAATDPDTAPTPPTT